MPIAASLDTKLDTLANTFYFHLQSYMDSEIMAIMSQYMPLDSQQANQVHTAEVEPLRQGSV